MRKAEKFEDKSIYKYGLSYASNLDSLTRFITH